MEVLLTVHSSNQMLTGSRVIPEDVILVSMDVTSLYKNIPQEEGIHTVCRAYETFYINKPPIPTQLLEQALRLILQENSFQFYAKTTFKHMVQP